MTEHQTHDLNYSNIDERDEKDEGLQLCLVWCHTHEEYEWHWIRDDLIGGSHAAG